MTTEDVARNPGDPPVTTVEHPAKALGRVDPDLSFIRALGEQTGYTFKRCFQCGTCSSTCELSPAIEPFPRKEMSWAAWGLRDRLLRDVDVWLCHQCNDCMAMCPRGGRPGDVLAAVRRECIRHYAVPGFLARWASRPVYAPAMLGIAASLLTLAILLRDPLAGALGMTKEAGPKIVFSYSGTLPQWLLNILFGGVTALVLVVSIVGMARFWRALKSAVPRESRAPPARGLLPSIAVTVKRVFTHERFAECTSARPRATSHALVVYGFLALTVVTIWVITSPINPLTGTGFVYPFNFWSPWKILANLGGLAVLVGGLLMLRDRLRDRDRAGGSTWFDGSLLGLILLVVLTGFLTEVLHFTRYEPHRHAAYYVHLVFVLTLILYLPYSKLSHLLYRTVAMVFAERIGRHSPPRRNGGVR